MSNKHLCDLAKYTALNIQSSSETTARFQQLSPLVLCSLTNIANFMTRHHRYLTPDRVCPVYCCSDIHNGGVVLTNPSMFTVSSGELSLIRPACCDLREIPHRMISSSALARRQSIDPHAYKIQQHTFWTKSLR